MQLSREKLSRVAAIVATVGCTVGILTYAWRRRNKKASMMTILKKSKLHIKCHEVRRCHQFQKHRKTSTELRAVTKSLLSLLRNKRCFKNIIYCNHDLRIHRFVRRSTLPKKSHNRIKKWLFWEKVFFSIDRKRNASNRQNSTPSLIASIKLK